MAKIIDPFDQGSSSGIIDPFDTTQRPTQEPVAEYEGAFQEFVEGAASGAIGIVEGIGELLGTGVDLATGTTNYAQNVNEGAAWLRETAGIDPAGIIGEGTEVIVQYALPGLGAATAVSKMSKAARLAKGLYSGAATSRAQKALQTGKELAAMGLADFAVSTDGTTGISDFFDGGGSLTGYGDTLEALETEQDTGLTGREEAGRRLRNRLRRGIEAAGFGFLVPAAAVGTVAAVKSPVGKAVTKPVVKTAEVVARPVVNVAGAAIKGAADLTAPTASKLLRAGADTSAGRFAAEQAGKLNQYVEELQRARLFGPTPGGPMGRTGEIETLNKVRNVTESMLGNAVSLLRPRGDLPQEIGVARMLVNEQAIPDIRRAEVFVGKLDDKIAKLSDKAGKVTEGTTSLHTSDIYKGLEDFMTAASKADENSILSRIPKSLHQDMREGKKSLQGLRDFVVKSETFKQLPIDTQKTIIDNLPTYFRRRFRIFEDINYKPTDDVFNTAVAEFKKDPRFMGEELTQIFNRDRAAFPQDRLDELGLQRVGAGKEARLIVSKPTDEAARLAANGALQRHRPKDRGLFGYKDIRTGRVAENQIQTGMFMERTNPPVFYRALLGEIDDAREKIVATTADLAEFKAVDDYFKYIKTMADRDEGIGKLFVSPERAAGNPAVIQGLSDGTYVRLGDAGGTSRLLDDATQAEDAAVSAWGPLYGYVVPKTIYKNLTQRIVGSSGNEFVDGIRAAYSAFLRGKGASQYSKTVLSPITQLRNVSTAAAFALAQGNVGKGVNLGESVRIVLNGIEELPEKEVLDFLEDAQRRGVIGTNTQLRELQQNISKGLGYAGQDSVAQQQSKAFAQRLQDTGLKSFLGGTLGKAQDLYQGGDDIWKIYNYQFEQQKLLNALRDLDVEDQVRELIRGRVMPMSEDQLFRRVADDPKFLDDLLKDRAADIVRNTVPNYNAVPEAVRLLRATPFGNFTAFPYEIMRTGTNTIAIGLDELMSPIPAIQKIGMRRLIGASTAFAGTGAALSEIGYALSGVTKEEMDAYQRSYGKPWEKNARLIPVGRDEETNMPKFINWSYSNPYGMLDNVLNAAMNRVDEGKRLGKSGSQIAYEAANGALVELFQPFMDESILYAKLKDAADPASESLLGKLYNIAVFGGRAGDPEIGAPVYRKEDSAGTKIGNSLLHILDAFIPGASPVKFRSGEPEPSRLIRGLVGTEDGPISSQDRAGREYEAKTEVLRAVTGVTPLDIDPEKAVYYRGVEYRNRIRDASNLLNSKLRSANVTPGEIVAAYREANEARFRIANEFHQAIEDMRTLGLSTRQINKILKENNIGGVDGILRNRFEPLYPSDTILDVMKRQGTYNQYPKKDILRLYREFKKRKFTVDEPRPSAPAPTIIDPFDQAPVRTPAPAPTIIDPFNRQGSLQMPQVLPTQARAPGPVNPALLGDNPIDAALNAQIANRQG